MTVLILQAVPFVAMVAAKLHTVYPKLHTVYRRFLHALDTFAEAKMRKAMPEWRLREVQREVDRYRRLMHVDR
jgi:hypothetical protein